MSVSSPSICSTALAPVSAPGRGAHRPAAEVAPPSRLSSRAGRLGLAVLLTGAAALGLSGASALAAPSAEAATGTCTTAKLYYEVCDPGNLGEKVNFPGKSRSSSAADAPVKTQSIQSTRGSSAAERTSGGSASGTNWDAVAECESGGDWSIDTGNGYKGGLQHSMSTWREYGGKGDPSDASREQQIAVAERVLDGQGIGAWPVCGKRG